MTDIPAFLDRRPLVFSYTFLNCYEDVCAYQCYRRYIVKDVPFVSTPAMEFGNRVHQAFEYRIGGGKPLPADISHWEPFAAAFDGRGAKTEMQIGLSSKGVVVDYFKGQDLKYRCKIDLHIANEHKAYLCDFKTGNSKYEKPFELEIQAMFLHAKYPQLKEIKGQYLWLKDSRAGQMYDLSNTQATWQKCEELAKQIQADRKSGEFEKRQGPLCKWCNIYDCEFNPGEKQ